MVKRLTEYFECGAYITKENVIDVSDKVKFFDNGCIMGKAIDKLAKVEDIMEKYGIESIELLEHIIKKGIVINSVIEDFAKEEYDKIKKDRDDWKEACKIASDILRIMGYKMCDTDRIDFNNLFYEYVRTEGNDE